jgi:geranylgeranyl pyrophosphate synthase
VDDILDFTENVRPTLRKTLSSDLREGKMTYPLMIGLERDTSGELRRILDQIVEDGGAELHRERIDPILAETDALPTSKTLAQDYAARARETLAAFPPSTVRTMLELIVDAVVERTH